MIEKLITKIARRLDAEHVPYMIIGGQAVLLYGRARLTRDVDITLGIDTDKFSLVEAICRKLNLNFLPENPEKFAAQTRVLPVEEPKSKIRVDFIFSFSNYEKQAINRAKEVLIENIAVKFASCEDLVIHKLIAGRAIDEEDVKSILSNNKKSIDIKYIKKWLSEFRKIPEHSGILKKFEKLLKE
jgi:predicted nucleotidyltransferase